LAVLDLLAFRADGTAAIGLDAPALVAASEVEGLDSLSTGRDGNLQAPYLLPRMRLDSGLRINAY
jgi:hypothetical protein